MANPWKKKVFEFNKKRAAADEKAADFLVLLDALPPGQVKQLMKNEKCAEILKKYGFSGE